jgi:Family of unknown function (DUF5684)
MKAHLNRLSLSGLGAFAVLMSAGVASAQSSGGPAQPVFAGAAVAYILVFALATYIYVALALQTIATKTMTANAWLAWIPIANVVLILNVAKKPLWWFLLFLIPLVNIVVSIMVWMAVAEARKKPNWWGILMIVPVVNMVVPGYLAWSD